MTKQIVFLLVSFSFVISNIQAQNIECIDNLIEIPLTGYKVGAIQWQFSTDKSTWIDLENQNSENLIFNIQETGYIRALVIDVSCSYYSDTVHIQVFHYPTTSDAGPDQIFVDGTTSVTLAGNIPEPDHGTGYWSITSGEGGSFVDSTDAGTVFTGSHCTDYALRWTIATPCSSSADDVVISFQQEPTISNAGPDQIFVDGTTSVTLAGNIPEPDHGTGYWSITSGEGGSFVDSTDAGTVFTGSHCTDYALRWTIATPCSSSADDVVISFQQEPTISNAGPDQIFVDGTTSVTLAGNIPEPDHGTGYWSITSGEGGSFQNANDPNSIFFGSLYESYILQWTISTLCSDSDDEVEVIFSQEGPGENIGDIDGNTYSTVWIGGQNWMAENLKSIHYSDSSLITEVYSYDNDESNANIYGRLYTWSSAMNFEESSSAIPSGIQGVCPSGWHLPSESEWMRLINYLGGESVAGGKLKESGTTHWNSPNTGATNEVGFSAISTGQWEGVFLDLGSAAPWWSTTILSEDEFGIFVPNLFYNSETVYLWLLPSRYGISVRCLKD